MGNHQASGLFFFFFFFLALCFHNCAEQALSQFSEGFRVLISESGSCPRVRGFGGSDFSFQTLSKRNKLLQSASEVMVDDGLREGSRVTTLDPQTDLANQDKPGNRKEYLLRVGSFMKYAALGSRPDIAYSVTALSRYNVQPLEMHITAAKRVLRYLKTTSDLRIRYRRPLLSPHATIPATTHSHHSFAKTLSACRVPIR